MARQRLLPNLTLHRIGDFLQRRQDIVRRVQWGCVIIYLLLLATPVLVPQSAAVGDFFIRPAQFAEAVFWGIWWPGAILATLLCGQFWCGLFCPDGTLTEAISRHGRAGKIPRSLRWSGWPLLAFALVTLAWHQFDARQSPLATLALLGGGSAAAWATGYFLGRGKRVWCRYLCPASSVFSLLARSAVLYFRVDRNAWEAAPRPLPRPVDCPQLLDVRRLRGNEKCSMCCRCSGHRNAVVLALRIPGQEIVALRVEDTNPREAFAICFVLIGLCYGVAYGQGSLAAVLLTAAALGGSVAGLLWLGAIGNIRRAVLMAYGLIPLAGIGLLLGALEYAQDVLSRSGIGVLAWLPMLRVPLLLAGSVWAAAIGLAMTRRLDTTPDGRTIAAVAHILAVSLVVICYL